MLEKPSYQQSLELRQNFLGSPGCLHYDASPLKIIRASKQYLYDCNNTEYLDCVSIVAHVGHCHAKVVYASNQQSSKINACSGFINDVQTLYAKRIAETLPDGLNVVYFVNSGSEATDLAIQLARTYTGHKDIICMDHAFNGNTTTAVEISPYSWKKLKNHKKKSWSHVIPVPDNYRGKYKTSETDDAYQRYLRDTSSVIRAAQDSGREIAGLIYDSCLYHAGIILPPADYWKMMYRIVHQSGALCIANENSSGLGRCGDKFWTFEMHDVIPDIVAVGKPLGNGQPLALVVTTKEIADCFTSFRATFGGNPVSCAAGLAVLDVIRDEKLLSAAKCVGKCLLDGFKAIMPNHPMLGDIRGVGLLVGVEIVCDKTNKKPATEATELLVYKMKTEHILVNNVGPHKNVLVISPPMCFTCDNARRVVQTLDRCLTDIEGSMLGTESSPSSSSQDLMPSHRSERIPLNILSGTVFNEEEMEGSDDDGPHCKRPRYEDLD